MSREQQAFAQVAALLLFPALGACSLADGSEGEKEPAGFVTAPTEPYQVDRGPQPGMVTLRRLNRFEYDNTVRDLLGTTQRPGSNFPAENLDEGFDVIGEALTIQPLHLELYEQAATALVDELLSRGSGDPIRELYIDCDFAAGAEKCLDAIVTRFAERAYRRPVTPEELESTLALTDQGDSPEEGLALALRAVLLSPHFIYRVELDPNPDSSASHPVSSYELATRLSYFLWSTMPDDELLSAAADGSLATDEELVAQVERMLGDERSEAFVENFAGQWLNLRRLDRVFPDYQEFPDFDDELRTAMRRETEMFFRSILDGDAEFSALLTASYTFLNGRLAEHYGIDGPSGEDFVRVDTSATERRGLLSQGSFLTLTSNPTRTSPVKRGKWVMDQLLCEGPPPPPPGVEADLETVGSGEMSVRERLALHRESPACAQCHMVMDPIGLSFENFDAIGAFRLEDESGPIDASGVLPLGEEELAFSGPSELSDLLADDPRVYTCAVEKLLSYGVGRKIEANDDALIESIVEEGQGAGGSLMDAVVAVVLSEGFRSRRAAP